MLRSQHVGLHSYFFTCILKGHGKMKGWRCVYQAILVLKQAGFILKANLSFDWLISQKMSYLTKLFQNKNKNK